MRLTGNLLTCCLAGGKGKMQSTRPLLLQRLCATAATSAKQRMHTAHLTSAPAQAMGQPHFSTQQHTPSAYDAHTLTGKLQLVATAGQPLLWECIASTRRVIHPTVLQPERHSFKATSVQPPTPTAGSRAHGGARWGQAAARRYHAAAAGRASLRLLVRCAHIAAEPLAQPQPPHLVTLAV